MAYNLLTEPLIRFETSEGLEQGSLPEVYAALMADRVECFSALRAHQEPAWHMFLAQLGAIACHRAGLTEPPGDADTWQDIIGRLTRDAFPDYEPWRLVVEDWSKPAFLQPPVPEEVTLKDEPVITPDALDMLITSRNHDLKQAVAAATDLDDWIFALISLQTMEGYGGPKNYGIARMNGAHSSRVLISLAPMSLDVGHSRMPKAGTKLKRDISQLLRRRLELLRSTPIPYPEVGGHAIIWTERWHEGEQFALNDLDVWFIEVCRRIRLRCVGTAITGETGNSAKSRIHTAETKGAVGDPWAPTSAPEPASLTLNVHGNFSYKKIVELLSPNWHLPLLAQLGSDEPEESANWLVLFQALARGQTKTGGFKSRAIPLDGRTARRLGAQRQELHQLAKQQIEEINKVDKALRNALALANAAGDREKMDQDSYARTKPYRDRLDAVADRDFFDALWKRFEAEQHGNSGDYDVARRAFLLPLIATARDLLKDGLADIPCPSIRRPRAEARARRWFETQLRSGKTGFPGLLDNTMPDEQEMTDAA